MPRARDATILLVEDDPGHARLIVKNLRRSDVMSRIDVVEDGQKALDYLFQDGSEGEVPLLVLLDLNLPVLDGYQVLQRMKADERFRKIPVIVLTTTDEGPEISRCYELGCNMYITKPVDYGDFSETIHRMGMLLSIVEVPYGA